MVEANGQEIRVYKIRWIVLILTSVLMFYGAVFRLIFGPISNVMVDYFKTSYVEIDWVSLSVFATGTLGMMVFAYCSLRNLIDLKSILIVASTCLLVGSALISVGFVSSKLFLFIVLGQSIFGITGTPTVLVVKVGANWFPENQIGFVTGIGLMVWNLGALFAEAVPGNIFINPITTKRNSNQSEIAIRNKTSSSLHDWYINDRKTAQAIFTVTSCCSFIMICVVVFFVPSFPKCPPSKSQAIKAKNQSRNRTTFKEFISETKSLFGDSVFVFIQIIFSLTVETLVLESVLIVQIIDPIHSKLNTKLTSNMIGGYILACRSVGDVIGSFVSGKVLDKFRNYRFQIIAGTFGTLLSFSAFLVSWYFASLSGLFTSMFMMGLLSYVSGIPLLDCTVQHTYPKNIIFVSSWGGFSRMLVTIVITTVGRQVYQKTDVFGLFIYHCVLQVLGFVLSLFVNPKLKRQQQEYAEDELIPLIDEITCQN